MQQIQKCLLIPVLLVIAHQAQDVLGLEPSYWSGTVHSKFYLASRPDQKSSRLQIAFFLVIKPPKIAQSVLEIQIMSHRKGYSQIVYCL